MGFSAKQLHALRRDVKREHIRSRTINGRELPYLEGGYVITEANRIFGFDSWDRETVESRCVLSREHRGTFLAVYTAKVRITVRTDGEKIFARGTAAARRGASRPVRRMISLSRLGNGRHQTRPRDLRKTLRSRTQSQRPAGARRCYGSPGNQDSARARARP